MRRVVVDTETTGLDPAAGHRVIEIAAVELDGYAPTGRTWQRYVNPGRPSDPQAFAVHGIADDFLRDQPTFAEIADDLLAFLDGGELVAHNAPFDARFLDAELSHAGYPPGRLLDRGTLIDTRAMARGMYPGQSHTLDALCDRLGIDRSHRTRHGALVDATLCAAVYAAMMAEVERMHAA